MGEITASTARSRDFAYRQDLKALAISNAKLSFTVFSEQPPRNFCDKMVTSFLPSFLSLILRQRRVNEMGTQQLLLDVYNLKTLMLKVPSLGECT